MHLSSDVIPQWNNCMGKKRKIFEKFHIEKYRVEISVESSMQVRSLDCDFTTHTHIRKELQWLLEWSHTRSNFRPSICIENLEKEMMCGFETPPQSPQKTGKKPVQNPGGLILVLKQGLTRGFLHNKPQKP